MAMIMGFGLLLYILLGFRHTLNVKSTAAEGAALIEALQAAPLERPFPRQSSLLLSKRSIGVLLALIGNIIGGCRGLGLYGLRTYGLTRNKFLGAPVVVCWDPEAPT